MLQTSSHLSRVCGQSHLKKFWLKQTQSDKQVNNVACEKNCNLSPSPSARSAPAASVKGPDSKQTSPLCVGSSAKRSLVTEAAPASRPSWPTVGSSSGAGGSGGSMGGNRKQVSLVTCAESLTPPLTDPVHPSFRHSTLEFLSVDSLNAKDNLDEDAGSCSRSKTHDRENGDLSATSSSCVSPSPNRDASSACLAETSLDSEHPDRLISELRHSPKSPIHASNATSVLRSSMELDRRSWMGSGSCVKIDHLPESVPLEDGLIKSVMLGSSSPVSVKEPVEFDARFDSGWQLPDGDDGRADPCSARKTCASNADVGNCAVRIQDDCEDAQTDDRTEEMNTFEAIAPNNGRSMLRTCKHCGTTKTPLWRSGPQGPKSLCNACGIRFKKARRSQAANESSDLQVSPPSTPKSFKLPSRSLKRKLEMEEEEVAKVRSFQRHKRSRWPTLMVVRRDSISKAEDNESCLTSPGTPSPRRINFQLTSSSTSSRRKEVAAKLALLEGQSRLTRVFAKDEEEAAMLLMALSCGLVLH